DAGAAVASRRDADVPREGARERRLRLEAAVERHLDERLARLDEAPADLGELALPDVARRRLAGERHEHAVEVPGRRRAPVGDGPERRALEEMCLDEREPAADALQGVARAGGAVLHGLLSTAEAPPSSLPTLLGQLRDTTFSGVRP